MQIKTRFDDAAKWGACFITMRRRRILFKCYLNDVRLKPSYSLASALFRQVVRILLMNKNLTFNGMGRFIP